MNTPTPYKAHSQPFCFFASLRFLLCVFQVDWHVLIKISAGSQKWYSFSWWGPKGLLGRWHGYVTIEEVIKTRFTARSSLWRSAQFICICLERNGMAWNGQVCGELCRQCEVSMARSSEKKTRPIPPPEDGGVNQLEQLLNFIST